MVGWIWHLRHAPQDETGRRRALDGLERSTALQARLINDLFDVSRISRGKLDLDVTRVDLERVVTSAIDAAEPSAVARDVTFNVATLPVSVLGDGARLHQVVTNLLTNAVKFSAQGGVIHVTLDASEGEAVLRVRDEGHGIDPALLPHIFDAFRQGGAGTTRQRGGLGLGLAIVRQLVRMHRGTVVAESAGPGHGATFTVHLPFEPGTHASVGAPAPPAGRELADRHVLIVDDDEDAREWLKALVESAGGDATTVASVREALEALETKRCDLLLSDIGLPGQDGLELIEEVQRRGWDVPAVAVTAYASPGDKRRVLAAGYDAYVTKPLDAAEFIATAAALSRPKPTSA
jgi:CheY-like chemotaxis protein/two-component sensor histidine kinase